MTNFNFMSEGLGTGNLLPNIFKPPKTKKSSPLLIAVLLIFILHLPTKSNLIGRLRLAITGGSVPLTHLPPKNNGQTKKAYFTVMCLIWIMDCNMVFWSDHHFVEYHLLKQVNCHNKSVTKLLNTWLLLKCSQATLPFKSWKRYIDQHWNNGKPDQHFQSARPNYNSPFFSLQSMRRKMRSRSLSPISAEASNIFPQSFSKSSLDDHFFHPFGMLTIFPGNPTESFFRVIDTNHLPSLKLTVSPWK